jgi:DNA-binding GntR family transcriptional regulator/transposase
MAPPALSIPATDRVALTKLIDARRTPRGQVVRARIVLACAEGTVGEAARRCDVSFRTAMKWKQRYEESGLAALDDLPRSGRPAATEEMVHRTLTCALAEPPEGGWTTRAVADATGVSQSTVCRIRRDHFPNFARDDGLKMTERQVVLAYAYVDPKRSALALHSLPTPIDRPRPSRVTTREITGAIETVLCAALVPDAAAARTAPPPRPVTTAELLRRATRDTPANRHVTVVLDADPDDTATQWLRRNPRVDVAVVPRERWLGQLHALAGAVDVRQLSELVDLQRSIRSWHLGADRVFEWSRLARTSDSLASEVVTLGTAMTERRASDSTIVIRGLYQAIADGTLHAGRRIRERTLAERVPLSSGVVADALRQLAEDGLVHQDDTGRFFVPAPNERDVIETYTARGLLGTALVRRLASRAQPLPEAVDDTFRQLVWYAGQHDVRATDSLDLDVQDELAHAADMPRIEAMFVRLTLQLRLFVTLMGLNYQYPCDDIVTDDTRILDAIHSGDPDAAVAAWRAKIDNSVRYMVFHLGGRS